MCIFNVLLLYFKGVYIYTIYCDHFNIYNNTAGAIYYDNINILLLLFLLEIFIFVIILLLLLLLVVVVFHANNNNIILILTL